MPNKSNEFKYLKEDAAWVSAPTSTMFEFALQNVCKALGKDCKILGCLNQHLNCKELKLFDL
jgi:hypothetical protein